jgi:hypothetical protein
VAELLASLAVLADQDRVVSATAGVLGAGRLAWAVPLLHRTRAAAAAASGQESPELARVQRVRPRTLLAIAALTGAFYYLLPKLAQVGSGWQPLQSAHWIWLPVVIAFSALTYLASAISLLGSVTVRLPFWPAVLTQGASSFVNQVSPANVGGMALNVRYLPGAGGTEPGQDGVAIRRLGPGNPGLYRWPPRLGRGLGVNASIAQVGAVYLVASFIAAASPTPGGLGAIEAATIAGLTGIGVVLRSGRVGRTHLPPGHLLAACAARLALLAPAAAHGLSIAVLTPSCAYPGPERPARISSAVASTASPSAAPPATSSGRWAPT